MFCCAALLSTYPLSGNNVFSFCFVFCFRCCWLIEVVVEISEHGQSRSYQSPILSIKNENEQAITSADI